MPLDAIPCPSAYVVDRDSLPCGSPRLKQLENASRPSFQRALGYRPITYRVETIDRFARLVVMAWAGQVNLPATSSKLGWLFKSSSGTMADIGGIMSPNTDLPKRQRLASKG